MFGFYDAQVRFYYEHKGDQRKIGEMFFSLNVFLISVLVVICLGLTLFGKNLYSCLSIKDIPFSPYVPVVIWIVFFQVLNQMVISSYLAAKQFKKCVIIQIVQFCLITASVIWFVVVMKEGAIGRLKGVLYGDILTFAIFYIGYIKQFAFRFSLRYVQYALSYGLPIVFHALSNSIILSIDRVILVKFVSIGELGIYTLGYQMGLFMSVIVGSINKAWTPNYFDLMSDDIKEKHDEVVRVISLWIVGMGCVCLIGMLWAKEFLVLLTPASFYAAAGVVPIIVFGYLIKGLYSFAATPIFYFKKTKVLPFLTIISAFVNIVLNFLLIPPYGIYGAAYATAITFGFQTTIVYLVSKRFFDPRYPLYKIGAVLVFIACMLPIAGFQRITVQSEVLKIFLMVIFVGLAFSLFSRQLKPLLCRNKKVRS